MTSYPRVGITMGDPAGVGPEICARALRAVRARQRFVVIGDRGVWERITSHKSQVTSFEFIDLKNVDPKTFRFGKIKAEYGRASIEYLDEAMELLKCKEIDCIVTCPISKEAISLAGYPYSGHTEYFAARTKRKPVMLLLNDDMRLSLVTRHIPLRQVPGKLTREDIRYTVSLTYRSLQEFFAIRAPRLVVCGINPHGSDNGVIGSDENDVIKPAIRALRKKFPAIDGPFGADVAIAKALQKNYDCVIAMYHDQALIPLKVLGDESGVNMTLGLGFVRTSPLHGTAFDIAGKGKASPASFIAALTCAIRCCQNQKRA